MTLKNLSYKTLVRRNLSSRLWLVALTLLGSLGTLLLPLFMVRESFHAQMRVLAQVEAAAAGKEILQSAQESALFLLSMDNYVVKVALVLLASVCGVAVFRYLHDRQQVDFYHALPINRTHLFLVNYVSGILLVLPLFVLVYAITVGAAFSMGFGTLLTGAVMAHTVLGHSLFFLVNYTVMVLCTVLTGNTIITVLLALWVQFSLPLAALMHQAWQMLLHVTFTVPSERQMYTITNGSPIVKYFTSMTRAEVDPDFVGTFGTAVLWYPLILGVVLLALSYVLFVRRRSERAGAAVAFEPLKAPLQWYMSLFMGSACALLFTAMFSGDSTGWAWFGLLFGVVLFHAIIEIIYEFDFRALFHHWKQMLILCAAAVAVFAGFRADIFGYDSYLPNQSQVAAVGLWTDTTRNYLYRSPYETEVQYATRLEDEESIKRVLQIAQDSISFVQEVRNKGVGLSEYPEGMDEHNFFENIIIAYQLKNGGTRVRSYNIPNRLIREPLDTLLTSEAYSRQYMELQQIKIPQNAADGSMELYAKFLGLVADTDSSKMHPIYAIEDIRRVIDTLQEEQLHNAKAYMSELPIVKITLNSSSDLVTDEQTIENAAHTVYNPYEEHTQYDYTIPVYPSDTKTLKLIQELMGVERKELPIEDIERIVIDVPYSEYDSNHREWESVEITDKQTIAELVQDAVSEQQRWNAGKYICWEYSIGDSSNAVSISLFTKSGDVTQIYYEKEKAPVKRIEQLIGKPLAVG